MKNKNTRVNLILTVISAVFSFIAALYLNSYIKSGFKVFWADFRLIMDKQTLVIFAILFVLCVLVILLTDRKTAISRLGKSESLDIGLENSHFMTRKEIRKNYRKAKFSKLAKTKSGIVVGAKERGKEIEVLFADPIHTLVIGNTGSGKTATFLSPTVQILSYCKDKPSMIIADPKGELLETHSKLLQENGYKVQVIDLINPLRSTRWNPLSMIYARYQEMLKGEDMFLKQEIRDEVFDQLNELVKCVFKANENAHDKIWENGMQNFILAVLLALLEDSEHSERGMTIEKFNFANVRNICLRTDNDCGDLKEYFAMRDVSSNARMLASGVLNTSDKTLQGYMTTIAQAMTTFADQGICAFMSTNEISFDKFDDEATALFLKIPDERQSRYNIASAFFSSAYRELVMKARRKKNGELARPLYFLIDEFGNLPTVPGIDKMLAVSRSRKIFFTLVLQSYEQLENVYGRVAADVIKGNCNIEAFIGSKETGTLEAFSKKCGNYSVSSSTVSVSSYKDGGSGSTATKERPLIYPSELSKLNNPPKDMGNTIVVASGKLPLKSQFTPIFKSKKYKMEVAEISSMQHSLFSPKENYYEITNVFLPSPELPEIPMIIEEEEEEMETEKSMIPHSKTLSKYLKLLDVIEPTELENIIAQKKFEKVLDLIVLGISKAKLVGNNHIISILNKELNLYKNLNEEINKQ